MEKFICKYCGKECKNKNSLAQHEIRCKENPNKISFTSNFIKYNNTPHKGTNQFIKAKELGLSIPTFSKETREKQGKAWLGKKHTNEEKQKISNGIQKAILEHPESYSGLNSKAKKEVYNGIKFDSSWEVDVAKYLDKNNIKWERVKTGFKYLYENKYHHYYPDFYLIDLNYYIEVKGYQRDINKDLCKWNTINNLIIIKCKEINDIKRDKYNIYDYIK